MYIWNGRACGASFWFEAHSSRLWKIPECQNSEKKKFGTQKFEQQQRRCNVLNVRILSQNQKKLMKNEPMPSKILLEFFLGSLYYSMLQRLECNQFIHNNYQIKFLSLLMNFSLITFIFFEKKLSINSVLNDSVCVFLNKEICTRPTNWTNDFFSKLIWIISFKSGEIITVSTRAFSTFFVVNHFDQIKIKINCIYVFSDNTTISIVELFNRWPF